MEKQQAVALVTSGPARTEPLSELNHFVENLGAVKATSLRHASRIVNHLKAGEPARSYKEIAECKLVLISAPEGEARRLITELAHAIEWKGRCAVLIADQMGTEDLRILSERGADVASLTIMNLTQERFVVEGDENAVRLIRELLIGRNTKLLRIDKARKSLYTAGMSFASSLFAPQADAAVECIRSTGVPLKQAVSIMEACVEQALRAYVKAGRKGWSGPLARADAHSVAKQARAVEELDKHLAQLFESNAAHARSVFRHEVKRKSRHGKSDAAARIRPGLIAADAGSHKNGTDAAHRVTPRVK